MVYIVRPMAGPAPSQGLRISLGVKYENDRLPAAPAGYFRVSARTIRDALQFDPAHGAGQNILDAWLRQVDRLDPSYKV